jgi:hypothetical protein
VVEHPLELLDRSLGIPELEPSDSFFHLAPRSLVLRAHERRGSTASGEAAGTRDVANDRPVAVAS